MNTITADLAFVIYACTLSVVAATTSAIISNHYERKHVRRIYDLFAFLQKSSEERIGKANAMVESCTKAIQQAAIASEHCARAAEQMASITSDIAKENSKQIEELRQDKNHMFEQMTAMTAQLAAYQTQTNKPEVKYETHNH